mgnify:CR=1 FL=1
MQKIRYSRYFKSIFIILDILVIVSVFVFYFYRIENFQETKTNWEQHFISLALLIFYWVLLSGRTKLYNIPRFLTYTLYLERLLTHVLVFILGVILLAKVSDNQFLNQDRFIIALSLFFILSFIKSLIFIGLKYARSKGFNHRNIMFLHENSSTKILKNILEERKDYGYKIFEFPKDQITNLEQLKVFWITNGIHTVYMPSENFGLEEKKETEIFNQAEINKVRISLVPNIIQNNFFEYDLGYIETQPILSQSKFPLDYLTNYILKRSFDILFSLFILVFVCSWLFPIIAIIIKLSSNGPIFFLQKRYGYHDEVFICIKFRTMVLNSLSTIQTTKENDTRITKFGKFLRKTSLDELPQFINVLKGEMSVVGPRPHMLLVDDFYKRKIGRYTVRSLVKPGVTGLAQVNGLRGDHGNMEVEMQKRILADSFYVRNWSLILDFVIIIKTIFLVIIGDKNAR